MTLEKPWKKEFDALLQALTAMWGGEISVPGRSALADLYFYPELEVRRGECDVRIRISEFPNGQTGYTEAADNVEYLIVETPVVTPLALRVSHEELHKKLHRLLGLVSEYQTGNRSFDQAYFLKTSGEGDERVASNPDFQKAVTDLEPFALIDVTPDRVSISRMITRKRSLGVESVASFVDGLRRLVKLAQRGKPK
jgi:hypothetical protein